MTRFDWRTEECFACSGTGETSDTISVYGEAFDADPCTVRCDDCGGTGEQDAACADCCIIRPLDGDGLCTSCAACLVEIEHLGPGRLVA